MEPVLHLRRGVSRRDGLVPSRRFFCCIRQGGQRPLPFSSQGSSKVVAAEMVLDFGMEIWDPLGTKDDGFPGPSLVSEDLSTLS